MKKLVILLFITAGLSASTLSMSDLQIMVNEDIVDYFSLVNSVGPVEWDDISEQKIAPTNSKNILTVSSLVQVTSYDAEMINSYLTDYICNTKLSDNGSEWNITGTACNPIEESENTQQ